MCVVFLSLEWKESEKLKDELKNSEGVIAIGWLFQSIILSYIQQCVLTAIVRHVWKRIPPGTRVGRPCDLRALISGSVRSWRSVNDLTKAERRMNTVNFSFKDSLLFKRLIKINLYIKICILFVVQLFGKEVGSRKQSPPPSDFSARFPAKQRIKVLPP